jgi:hypothetical protein
MRFSVSGLKLILDITQLGLDVVQLFIDFKVKFAGEVLASLTFLANGQQGFD